MNCTDAGCVRACVRAFALVLVRLCVCARVGVRGCVRVCACVWMLIDCSLFNISMPAFMPRHQVRRTRRT